MENRVLVVLGMHRSGTSVLAQWLHKCGLNIGDQLHGPYVGNPDGHFEDVDFLQLHEEILSFYNLSVVGITDHALDNISDQFIEKIKELVSRKNALYQQWGWKEPRTCLFLKHYPSLLPDARFVVVVRHYNDVVSSLVKRNVEGWQHHLYSVKEFNSSIENFIYRKVWNLTKQKKNQNAFLLKFGEQYLKTWICYNEELLKHINIVGKENTIVCDLSTLIHDPKNIFSHIQSNWHFDIDYVDFNSVYKQKLIKDHIDLTGFIKNKSLLEKADALQQELKKHLFRSANTKEIVFK